MAPNIITYKVGERWMAVYGKLQLIADTEKEAREKLKSWIGKEDSKVYCRYCQQSIDYCICSSLA